MSITRPTDEELEQARRDTDWARLDAMTDEERTANAKADPDNPPLSEIGMIRRKLGFSQREFADVFRIPPGTLRDWEQERTTPDGTARAYLLAIDRGPGAIVQSLVADAEVWANPVGDRGRHVVVRWTEGAPVSAFRPEAAERLAARVERLGVAGLAAKLRAAAREARAA